MEINLLNYSKQIKTNTLKEYMEELTQALINKGVDMSSVVFTYDDIHVAHIFNNIMRKHGKRGPLLDNFSFQYSVNEAFNEKKKVVIIGENFRTVAPWGDAWEIIAIISTIYKVAIWHEVAHLLGADDYYDYDTKAKVDNCKLEKCIMQYGCCSFEFCDQAVLEINERLFTVSP